MVTISFDSVSADKSESFVKEFKQKRSAATFMKKTFDKQVINDLTTSVCSGMIWWEGEIQCDVPFKSFLDRPSYINNEDDKPVKKSKRRR